jgi:L-cystine uptake protein TcyP (sodium:dicarboxylate symporter family)
MATEVRLGEEALTWLNLQSKGFTALLQEDLMPLTVS